MKPVTLLFCLLALLPLASHADSPRIMESEKATFALEEIIDGLGIPWGMMASAYPGVWHLSPITS